MARSKREDSGEDGKPDNETGKPESGTNGGNPNPENGIGNPPGEPGRNPVNPPGDAGTGENGGTGKNRKRGSYKPRNNGDPTDRTGKTKGKTLQNDLSNLAKQVQGAHLILAQMTGFEELMVTEPESLQLAQVITDISREYHVKLNSKYTVLIQAGLVLTMVYAPRVYMINQKIKLAKMEQQSRQRVAEDTVKDREDRPIITGDDLGNLNNGGQTV